MEACYFRTAIFSSHLLYVDEAEQEEDNERQLPARALASIILAAVRLS